MSAGLRDSLGDFRPRALLILDEAHHAAPASGARYAIDSQITRAVRDLAGRFEHRLFLSATPHNGHSNSFSALLEMLDPQRFTRGVEIRPKELEPVMVRRLKEDLRRIGESFPERVVEAVPSTVCRRTRRSCACRHARRLWASCARSALPGCRRRRQRRRASCLSACSSACFPPSRRSPAPSRPIARPLPALPRATQPTAALPAAAAALVTAELHR